jgi:hypothetical protein
MKPKLLQPCLTPGNFCKDSGNLLPAAPVEAGRAAIIPAKPAGLDDGIIAA